MIRLCRECGGQVSTEADVCPQCGVNEPTREGAEPTAQAKGQAAATVGGVMLGGGCLILLLLLVVLTVAAILA